MREESGVDDKNIKNRVLVDARRPYAKPMVTDLGAVREVTRGPNGSFNDGGGAGAGMAGSAQIP